MKTKEVVWHHHEGAWDHASCCLDCLTTTHENYNENLSTYLGQGNVAIVSIIHADWVPSLLLTSSVFQVSTAVKATGSHIKRIITLNKFTDSSGLNIVGNV